MLKPAAISTTLSTGHGCWPARLPSGPFSLKTTIQGKPVVQTNRTIYISHTCLLITHAGVQRKVLTGSTKVTIEGYPASRTFDNIACGDKIGSGSNKVFIGG
jgi:uncharacterized Zn-binding protein involved in type VI secretion